MDLSRRSTQSEAMDDPAMDEAAYRRCLADLAVVNRVTLTHRATLRWLSGKTRALPRGREISVLDVGCGQGDLLRAIADWARRRQRPVVLMGLDLNPRSAASARAAGEGEEITYLTGDVFAFQPPRKPDFIVTSQFTHHLPDDQIVQLLGWLEAHAAQGWHIADLHRHWFAYHGYPLLARLFGWHPIVRVDGQISIARGFTRAEWVVLLARAGLQARITWQPLFRHAVST